VCAACACACPMRCTSVCPTRWRVGARAPCAFAGEGVVWLAGWLAGRGLAGWLAGWVDVQGEVRWMECPTGQLDDLLHVWLAAWLAGCISSWPSGCLAVLLEQSRAHVQVVGPWLSGLSRGQVAMTMAMEVLPLMLLLLPATQGFVAAVADLYAQVSTTSAGRAVYRSQEEGCSGPPFEPPWVFDARFNACFNARFNGCFTPRCIVDRWSRCMLWCSGWALLAIPLLYVVVFWVGLIGDSSPVCCGGILDGPMVFLSRTTVQFRYCMHMCAPCPDPPLVQAHTPHTRPLLPTPTASTLTPPPPAWTRYRYYT